MPPKRDSRKWEAYIVRVKAHRACPDSPDAAQVAPSTPQAVASREPEPDPSPAHLRPLPHRVDIRPDPPTQATLEDLGLSDLITEPDPDLCVETEHHLTVPRDPVYKMYKRSVPPIICPHSYKDDTVVKCLHNTSTNLVTIWYSQPEAEDEKFETRPASFAMKLRYLQPKYECNDFDDQDLACLMYDHTFIPTEAYPENELYEPFL
jgi:hypothetical protein